ncbi:MAG: UDP-2,3-diacylglucosamine diphosphatase [Methylotenera sp.]|nr:UDP-2,3-diacylglucosamine diphosphatase [Methylotenera sp.]
MLKPADKSGYSLFISDLHLCASRPEITSSFIDFLQSTAVNAEALYILGDLFEYWAGDDDMEDVHHQTVIIALKKLANTDVNIYFMHGNRDFLIGADFCNVSNITLLQDPTLIDLYGNKTLLSHGDALCTDDIDYQDFRRQVRQSKWQSDFLSQPLRDRKTQIEAIRMRSEQEKSGKSTEIMDVNPQAVEALLLEYGLPAIFIHGHTHRPHQHQLKIKNLEITRWVLGDWYEQGSYLICNHAGCSSSWLS